MPRRSERSLLHAAVPDNPIPGIVGGLAMTALLGGIFAGMLLWATIRGGPVVLFLGSGALSVGQTLISLNNLPAYLKYERYYEPDPNRRPSHRAAAFIAAILFAIIVVEILVVYLAVLK